jgi:predicted MFS family arabinose efflux permease
MPNPIERLAEVVVPADLGRGYRLLLGSAVVTNVGDGLTLAAGPLLVASLTRDPFLVSMATLSIDLPVLLFGFLAGVTADRVDRRRVVTGGNLIRALVMIMLAATIVTGSVSITIVLVVLLILGTIETFADVGTSSLVPRLVPRARLGLANARLQSAFILANQLVAPPIGAFLFAAGMALPFATDAVCFAIGGVMVWQIVVPALGRRLPAQAVTPGDVASAHGGAVGDEARGTDEDADRPGGTGVGLRRDTIEGIRWLLGNPPMRTLALTIFAFNVTYGAAWSVLVLYAQERLDMDAVGFGLLTTALAIGGIIGTAAYGRLERRFSLADIMRVGLLIETGTHLVLALTTQPTVALLVMVVFGAHAFVWGTTATVVRQRAVPDALLGRVTSVYQVGLVAGIVIGTPIGGLLARTFGITAPFWFGFLGSALLVTILWRRFDRIVHASETAGSD